MKMRWLLCSIALLGILGSGGCTDSGVPTEPESGLSLSGAWNGAITYYDSSPCSVREDVAVTLSQAGKTLTGSFHTSCQGPLELRGVINGDSITGELSSGRDGVHVLGSISGTASRTSIQITTWGSQARRDNGPRVRPVINVIDLRR